LKEEGKEEEDQNIPLLSHQHNPYHQLNNKNDANAKVDDRQRGSTSRQVTWLSSRINVVFCKFVLQNKKGRGAKGQQRFSRKEKQTTSQRRDRKINFCRASTVGKIKVVESRLFYRHLLRPGIAKTEVRTKESDSRRRKSLLRRIESFIWKSPHGIIFGRIRMEASVFVQAGSCLNE
jgi:hypothetical protein